MAAGDSVIETGSVSGSSSTTITVPAGEVWVISAYGKASNSSIFVEADDGTNTPLLVQGGQTEQIMGMADTRPVFDDSTDPKIENNSCNSEPYYIGGREI